MEKTVTVTIKAPEPCTEEQFIEFIRFELRDIAQISIDNPLSGYDLGCCCPEIESIE